MKSIFNKWWLSMALVVMTLSLSSCVVDDDYYYDDYIVGVWQYDSPYELDIDKYAFYSDGTGSYGWYDRNGYWCNESFYWEANGRYVYIDFDYSDDISFRYSVEGDWLYLTSGGRTDAYYRVWDRASVPPKK